MFGGKLYNLIVLLLSLVIAAQLASRSLEGGFQLELKVNSGKIAEDTAKPPLTAKQLEEFRKRDEHSGKQDGELLYVKE